LSEMSPYLLFGFLMAGLLSVLISPEFVERHLGRRGLWSVLKASAFGVPLPLCSCSVIPVTASIRRHGAGKGAATAFLISTPQTGVDSILATFSLLGPVFAIYRPIAALVSGVLGGAVVSAVETDAPADPPAKCDDVCCSDKPGRGAVARVLEYGFVALPRDIGRTLLVGLAVAALISAIVPEGYFSTVVPPGPAQVLLLMLVGVPVYICATASIPVAAGLILAGVSPGAAFALLVTGPATNAATVATVWKLMGRRTCLIYLATMMVSALAGGLLLDQIVSADDVQTAMHRGWMPGPVKAVSAVALLGLLGVGALYRPRGKDEKDERGVSSKGETLTLAVSGMTCSRCAASVKQALLACPGAEGVEVDLAAGRVKVEARPGSPKSGGALDAAQLCEAVAALGYDAKADPDAPPAGQ